MQYNYDFEMASLLIMMILLVHFVFVRQFPGDKTKMFGMLLAACMAECGANILSCVGLANATFVPQVVNEILAFAFFALEGLTSYLIFRYFMLVCRFEDREKKVVQLLGCIPFLFFCLMLVLTPFIGFFYYFKAGRRGMDGQKQWIYIRILYRTRVGDPLRFSGICYHDNQVSALI